MAEYMALILRTYTLQLELIWLWAWLYETETCSRLGQGYSMHGLPVWDSFLVRS